MKNSLRLAFTAVFATTFSLLSAQLNMELVGRLDYEPTVNDVWGYADSSGIEYALIGHTDGFSIVTLEDPSNPTEVAFIEGQATTWRDIKTWGHFAYVVSDNTSEGMLIVDMQHLPDSVEYIYWAEEVGGFGKLRRSHNIFIDEFGTVFLAGCNLGGIVAFDVDDDPWNPRYINRISSPYSHDVYVRNHLVYASEIYEGTLTVYDFSDSTEFRYLGSATTPFEFTHNAWLSDDGNYCFTTDERANAFIGSYDVSDPANIRELDRYRPASTLGAGVIPHNVHVWDDYLIISYYTDGCILVDASQPDNLIEVGNFDTFLGVDGGYNGAWGAYPFLPSGLVLTSDRQTGLYVFEPNYVRGCYMDVEVLDATNEEPIFNAEVSINANEIITPDLTGTDGLVKMGTAMAGTFDITATHPEYRAQTVSGIFQNGVQNGVTIYLEPKSVYSIKGQALRESDEEPVPFANVAVTDGYFFYETTADSKGGFTIDSVFEGSYQVYAGLFDRHVITEVDLNSAVDLSILVPAGYYDDFHFDYGWTVTGTSTGANWVRDIPILETFFGFPCNPEFDVPDDFADEAFMTGNLGGNAEDNSVERGFTLLSSPEIDMSGWNDPVISFRAWLCVRFPDLQVYSAYVSNGTDTVLLDTIWTDGNIGYWRDAAEYHISDSLIGITSTMKIHFKAENNEDANTVKAALDVFRAWDADPPSTASIDPVVNTDMMIFPNPGSDILNIQLGDEGNAKLPQAVEITDILGRRSLNHAWPADAFSVRISHQLQPGIYFVSLLRDGSVVGIRKYIVD